MNALLKNINVLNIALAVLAGVSFFIWVYPLLHTNIRIEIPKGLEDVAGSDEEASNVSKPSPMAVDYAIVTDKNLFHPERRYASSNIAKEDQPIERPDILYFGSVITSEKKIAYIEDKKNPYSTPGRGKRQTHLAEGAIIGGYTLKEVNPENIVLVRGDDKFVINLRDEKDRKPGETTVKPAASSVKPRTPSSHTVPPMPPEGKVSSGPIMPHPGVGSGPGPLPPTAPPRPSIKK